MALDIHATKSRARTELHNRLSRSANCYVRGTGDPTVVTCRVFERFETSGSLTGGGDTYAERWADNPVLIFLVALHHPARGNIYALSTTEVYAASQIEPVDGVTVSAQCARLEATDFDADTIVPPEDS